MKHAMLGALVMAAVVGVVLVLKPDVPTPTQWGSQRAPIGGHCALNDSSYTGVTQGATPCGPSLEELLKEMGR